MVPMGRLLVSITCLLIAVQAYSATKLPISNWISLDSDSKSRIKKIIQTEVENREGFSTSEEEKLNLRAVEDERQREMSAYKASINSANKEFSRSKKRRDDLTTQFQAASYDFEESQKNIKTIKTGIINIDNQLVRYEQDIKTQQESLKKWLRTEKQGEAVVAVIYTRGFKDKAHDLEGIADQASSPLMAQYMGTYIQSFTKVIGNVLSVDFIRAIEEGTAKWNNEEPLRVELAKGNRGTTYLRLKRYELYPFQEPKTGKSRLSGEAKNLKAVVISSSKDLESFLVQNKFSPKDYDLGRAEVMIRETLNSNKQAEEGLKEQVASFRDRINALQEKSANTRSDRELQTAQLKKKELHSDKLQTDLELLKQKKETSDKTFHDAQTSLHDLKKTHESIIVKTSLATTKGSQTPAEASAEAIIDKLEEVRNDARTQHSRSTTDVVNFQVAGESSTQAVTDARIIAARLIAFINEGDSVRVKMAFRVRTALEEKEKKKEKGFFDDVFSSSSKDEPSPQVAKKEPPPKRAVVKEEPVDTPAEAPIKQRKKPAREAEEVAVTPAPVPKRSSKVIASAEAEEFFFALTEVKRSGNELSFFVEATNKSQGEKYVAFYDETSRYTKSTLTDDAGKTHQVNKVFLWQGNQKISAYDASRGVSVEAGGTVPVQLIFKNVPTRVRTVRTFNIHPYTAVRMIFFKWRESDLPFKNIRIRR